MHSNHLSNINAGASFASLDFKYNRETQINEFNGESVTEFPQHLSGSDYTGTGTNNKTDTDDDQTSDI